MMLIINQSPPFSKRKTPFDFGVSPPIGKNIPNTNLGNLFYYPPETINLMKNRASIIAQPFGATNITCHMCRRQPAPFSLQDFSEHYNLDGLFYHTRNVPETTKEAIREIITSLSSPQSTESLGLEEIYGRLSKVETDFAQLEQQMERLRVGAQNPLINHTHSHDFFRELQQHLLVT